MMLDRTTIQKRLVFCALLCASLLLSSSYAHAQGGSVDSAGTGGRHSIRGRVVFPSGQRADLRLKVRLESSGYGELTVFSDSNGSFSFQSLTPGTYTVVVEGGEFYETARETVVIETAAVSRREVGTVPISRPFTVQVYLRLKTEHAETRSGVLNAALAQVPKPAADLYAKALKAAQNGDHKKSIEHLKAALSSYPEFTLALAELGVQYLKVGEPDKAADALAIAVKLAPEAFPPRLNYGVALLNLGKFAPAETQFRTTLEKNELPTARMYLGIALAMQRKLAEAEKELIAAIKLKTAEVNLAHRYLGGVYIATHEYKRAADELEIYLKLAPQAADAARIRATISDLRNKP